MKPHSAFAGSLDVSWWEPGTKIRETELEGNGMWSVRQLRPREGKGEQNVGQRWGGVWRKKQGPVTDWKRRQGKAGVWGCAAAPGSISQSIEGKMFLISMLPLPASRKIVSTSTRLTGEFKSLKHMLRYSNIRYCNSARQKEEKEHMFSESKQIPVGEGWGIITGQKWYFSWKLLEGRDNVL